MWKYVLDYLRKKRLSNAENGGQNGEEEDPPAAAAACSNNCSAEENISKERGQWEESQKTEISAKVSRNRACTLAFGEHHFMFMFCLSSPNGQKPDRQGSSAT